MIETYINLGACLKGSGQLDTALNEFRTAYELGSRVLGPTHLTPVVALAWQSEISRALRRWDQAETLGRAACEAAVAALGEQHPTALSLKNNLAAVLTDQGKDAEAEAVQREVHGAYRALFGEAHPNTLGLVNNLGTCLLKQGRLEEAQALLVDGLKCAQGVLQADHPTLKALEGACEACQRRIDGDGKEDEEGE